MDGQKQYNDNCDVCGYITPQTQENEVVSCDRCGAITYHPDRYLLLKPSEDENSTEETE